MDKTDKTHLKTGKINFESGWDRSHDEPWNLPVGLTAIGLPTRVCTATHSCLICRCDP